MSFLQLVDPFIINSSSSHGGHSDIPIANHSSGIHFRPESSLSATSSTALSSCQISSSSSQTSLTQMCFISSSQPITKDNKDLPSPEPEGKLFEFIRTKNAFFRYKLSECQIFTIVSELDSLISKIPRRGPKGLITTADKLLYYLEWLSTGATQTHIGLWQMNEKKRRPVLIEGDDLFGDVALLVDVTSIRTEKPVGSFENQKLLWDGHHKVYGVKIQVAVAASHPFEALFISEVVEGHIHDFSLFKRDLHPLIEYLQVTNEDRHKNSLNESNAQWKIMADRGYQGVVEGLELIIPIKNTKAKEEIEYNAQLAEKRIPVEWFFGRMKRLWKLLANRYRNGLDDAKIDIEIAVWLTNLNIQANDLTEDDGKFEQQYVDTCGETNKPCATVEYALGCVAPFSDASLTLLDSTFTPAKTLTFRAPNTKITGNGTDATTIASSSIPQPASSSSSSSPDPSASSALFQQTQGSLTVSALAIAHNSTNPITPILFHLSDNSPSLSLNTPTITGTTSITIKTPLFFLTAGSLALNHTVITQLSLNSQSIFHLTSLTNPLTLNSSNITHITSTSSPTSCVLSSATSPALSLSLANCTITNINSEHLSQQTATDGGCISFASSASANTFSVSESTFSTCSVSEDTSSGGRGGALMIEFKDDSEVSSTTFSITNIVFSANKASVGRDMYFVCGSLVVSVKEPLFTFMKSIDQKDNSIVGHDRTEAFGDWNVDLFIFFYGFFDDTIFVDGTSGVEELYCGLEKAPCLNVNYGMGHL
ncbi:putative nuclease HARBI1 [Monocercomonoides exilis]|uniref:putative nuclease HARBI1 n=1 Tax=Monocercomonoides exilis TaxID=2049356 RepID=UPI0035594B6E|nr:putative nuclease HARBI1 [Monocercomonoides exilis]|eukprot:MONOS_10185.1-p1 / transcript=MONOS_10185.1 / gene=MONOS_10185 / organism=Monocercomonoides_exilis_PA203 / gene_product=unspecified product / transcript_product=unspecified product / location=Mono_scaffold00452:20848-24038(-) / protein_length=764 / sequence_SO=supercontig / SO=protein_coding / is_pseudo=false